MAKKKSKKKKKNNNKKLIFILILITVLAAVFFLFYINDFDINKVKSNTQDYLIQMGIIENPNKTEVTTTKKSDIKKTIVHKDGSSYTEGVLEGIDASKITLCEDGCIENVIYENFEIHFMELGNDYTGDSTYIKVGDIDILIDAGSRQSSSLEIIDYVDKYCTDGKLEYVISTHAHQDHIAGFVGTNADSKFKNTSGENIDKNGIFYYYSIETLIQFSQSDVTSSLYTEKYVDAVNYLKTKGTTVLEADDCFNNTNGGKSHYSLSETLDISFDIIYNKYYFEKSNDENNYSVCTMFNYNDNHFLLTGDLEEGGEEAMAEYYDGSTEEKTLPHMVLFKAGHHGSGTSSNDCLLNLITPDICCVCCCAGSTEYTPNYQNVFPTQAFIDRIKKHTDRVYVTTMYDEKEKIFKSMNGDIVVSSNGNYIGLYATNNLTKLKDTSWFNEEIYVLYDSKSKVYNICPKLKSTDFYTKDTDGAVKVTRRTW